MRLIPSCIDSSSDHWCIWSILDQTSVMQWIPLFSSWWNQGGLTRQQQNMFSDIWRGQSSMDWSTPREMRSSWVGLQMQIGLEAQWIGRVPMGIVLVSDQGMTSWCSRKQKSVAQSSAKGEYMEASTASCEAIRLHKLLLNLLKKRMKPTGIVW